MKDNTRRFKNSKIAIIITLITSLISLVACIIKALFLSNADSGTFLLTDVNLMTEGIRGLAIVLFIITYLISAILFILWFRRCYFNLSQKIEYLKHSEGWAAGGWFVPFVNLYIPYQIMSSIIEEYQLILGIEPNDKQYNNLKTVVGYWWALYLISGIVFRLSDKVLSDALPDHITYNNLIMFSVVLSIGSGILLIYIMNKVRGLEVNFQLLEDIDLLNKTNENEE